MVNDWELLEKIKPAPNSTGETFYVGYIVNNIKTDKKGYLKAIDFSNVYSKKDFVAAMNEEIKNTFLKEIS